MKTRVLLAAAFGGVLLTATAASAQDVGNAVNGIGNGVGNAVGAGLAVPGQILGGIGSGINGIGNGVGGVVGTGLAVPGDVLGGLGAGLGGLGGGLGAGLPGAGGDGFRAANLQGAEQSIATSQVALERARSSAVRQYAKLQLDQQISNAAALGVAAAAVTQQQGGSAGALATMPRARVDRAYVRDQIALQQHLLQVNMEAINSPADPAVRRVSTLR